MTPGLAQRIELVANMAAAAHPPAVEVALITHPSPFWCELTVVDSDLSATIKHVSNVRYIAWLDRAAELHADSLGFSRGALLEQGVMWFVARHEVDYVAEALLGDRLMIATWIREVRRVKAWRDYLILRPADSKVICRASTLWVLVDLATRKPCRLSAAMTNGFAPLSVVEQPEKPMVSSCTSR